MRDLQASIEIDAPAERVWDVVSALSRYGEWNPFMTQAEGELIEGTKLAIRIQPPGGRQMQFKPTVLDVEPKRSVRWLGRFILPGIFDGEHTFPSSPSVSQRPALPGASASRESSRPSRASSSTAPRLASRQ